MSAKPVEEFNMSSSRSTIDTGNRRQKAPSSTSSFAFDHPVNGVQRKSAPSSHSSFVDPEVNGIRTQKLPSPSSAFVDLTISDSEPDHPAANLISPKRKASEISTSPVSTKKATKAFKNVELAFHPRGTIKQGIPEIGIRHAGYPDGPSMVPPPNFYRNVLVNPKLYITPETAKGFRFRSREEVVPTADFDYDAIEKEFKRGLKELPGPRVRVINEVDDIPPPGYTFKFISENEFSNQDVVKLGDDFMTGCECRRDNGRHIGCEKLSCECVEIQDPDETTGKRHFPYSAAKDYGCLRTIFLKSRRHIYECNNRCNCALNCKNRVVQHGRQIPLDIFKTTNRGWGVRSPWKLPRGQFVDTYRGEVITNAESNARGELRNQEGSLDNYQFCLDKFCEETITKREFLLKWPRGTKEWRWFKEQVKKGEYEVTKNAEAEKLWLNPTSVLATDGKKKPYTIDGKYMGGPTRFINHSCEPNCAIYTVSYNHADHDYYELAFFTLEEIPADTELTFDYKDDDTKVITDEMANKIEKDGGERPLKCLCGSEHCRGYFFAAH